MITSKSNLCLEDSCSTLGIDFNWPKIFVEGEEADDKDLDYNSYIEKSKKYKEFYFVGETPIMFASSIFKKKLPYDLIRIPHPQPTYFSDDIYSDVEEVLTVMRNRVEKYKVNKTVTVTFFKDSSTIQIHTPRFVAIPIKEEFRITKPDDPKVFYKPVMYDLIPYLEKSNCIGKTDEYPYNAIRFKNFESVEILQMKKQ